MTTSAYTAVSGVSEAMWQGYPATLVHPSFTENNQFLANACFSIKIIRCHPSRHTILMVHNSYAQTQPGISRISWRVVVALPMIV